MSERNPHDLDPSGLSPGARLRAIADAELPGEHAEGIEGAEARIAFERALRESVGRSMASGAAAPQELRDRVRLIFQVGEALAAPAEDAGPDSAHVIRTPMGDTRSQSFWSGTMTRIVSVAAVLTMIVGVIFISRQGTAPAQANSLQAGVLAAAVEKEHERCETDKSYEEKLLAVAKTREEAAALAQKHLGGVPPVIRDASVAMRDAIQAAGFKFAGMGPCHVPGKGPSVHIIFRGVNSTDHMASLFIQVDRGQWDLDENRYARLKENLEDEETVFVWLDEGFLHILFVDSTADGKALRAALGTPAQEGPLKPR